MIELGERVFSVADVSDIAASDGKIRLTDAARARVAAAHAVVLRHAAGAAPVYGLNTGLGGNLAHRLTPAEIPAFQEQVIRGRMIGMGEPLPAPVARAALFSRIVGLAKGGAGLTPAVLDGLVAMFNAGITPVVPSRGSIGAGDLGLCAHLAAPLIGRGEAWVGGRRLSGADALAAAGLTPAVLGPKDGLGLINASAVSLGYGALTLAAAGETLLIAAAVAALAAEGYGANPAIFDPRLAAARPAASQSDAAALFRLFLDGSALLRPGAARAIQDAISFRSLSQIFGVAFQALARAAAAVETELNGTADNPLVLADDGEILSTANFHTPEMALAFDTLAIALAHLATAGAWRVAKLLTPSLSGLPKYLSPAGGASTGLNSLQKTAAALHAEIRLKAAPASLDALPVSETVEDHAPQTPLAIAKLDEQLEAFRLLLAIEAMTAAQAADLRYGASPALGCGSRLIYAAVRDAVPVLTEDRETGPDAMRVAAALAAPELAHALAELAAPLGLPFPAQPISA